MTAGRLLVPPTKKIVKAMATLFILGAGFCLMDS